MTRLLLLGLAVSAALGWPAAAIEIQLAGPAPDCAPGHEALKGTATAEGTTIRFFSCARGVGDCRSWIRTDDGGPLTEVRVQDAALRLWVGGVEVTDGVTDAWAAEIGAALGGPARSVAAKLFPALRTLGLDGTSDALRCLSYHGQAYDDTPRDPAGADCGGRCNDKSSGCEGCCGPGCTGSQACGTACTWECFMHDQFCGLKTDGVCLSLLVLAAKSMLDCYGTHEECSPLTGRACECC